MKLLQSIFPKSRRAARTRAPGSGFAESTLAHAAWERARRAAARWGLAGMVCGGLVALVAFAPAAWLADWVATQSSQRLLLADARGTVWNGSARLVLTGGTGSRSAAVLGGRTEWALGLRGTALQLVLRQSCCINDRLVLLIRPSLGGASIQLQGAPGAQAEWPAAFLAGLGAPWNTLQLSGTMRLASPGLTLQRTEGRWSFDGAAEVDLVDIATPLATVPRLGTYRLQLSTASGRPSIGLRTLDGTLLLDGRGEWTSAQLRFRGEARAAPGAEGALDNLLNLFGRRQGALALIAIG